MHKKYFVSCIAVLLLLGFSTSLCARGLLWDFLGDVHLNHLQDHDSIQVSGEHGPFRAIQLRVRGDAIFFQRIVAFYENGTSEELSLADLTSRAGTSHVIDLTGEPRTLKSVGLWYFKQPWENRPRVTLYGTR